MDTWLQVLVARTQRRKFRLGERRRSEVNLAALRNPRLLAGKLRLCRLGRLGRFSPTCQQAACHQRTGEDEE